MLSHKIAAFFLSRPSRCEARPGMLGSFNHARPGRDYEPVGRLQTVRIEA